MTSKERVHAAIARQPVDRVPLGFYAADHDTVARVIGRPTYVRNKIEMQVALWEGRRDELAEGLKADAVEFYRKMDCVDIILPKEACILPPRDYEPLRPRKIGEDRWEDRQGRVYQAVREANELQCVHDPTRGSHTYRVEDFDGPVDEQPPDESMFEVVDHLIAELGEERYVCTPTAGMTALVMLGGTENGLLLYALQPELVQAAARRYVALQNRRDDWHLRPGAAGVLMEQDMAGSNGPLVSPASFREMCLPHMKARLARVKQDYDQVVFHNCGNNLPLMDMFIETGIDCYQSLQTTAGMEVGKLKELFGHRLAFWGGVAVEVLIQGTPSETRQEVRRAMDRGARGGGFILGPSHSIAYGTKYDNLMAMIDEFVKLREVCAS